MSIFSNVSNTDLICANCSHLSHDHTQADARHMSPDPFICRISGCGCKGFIKPAFVPKPEAVNHPSYYGGENNPYEAIKVIEAWRLDFCVGNAVKYLSRAGKKDPTKLVEDLEKAVWYINRRIEQIEQGK